MNIVVTMPYLMDIISSLFCLGEKPTIRSLLPAGKDPHSYTLTPHDAKAVAMADLFVALGNESYLDVSKVNVTKSLVLTGQMQFKDPHVWHSAQVTSHIAQVLSASLLKVGLLRADTATVCLAKFQKAAAETASMVAKILSPIPQSKRILITNHDSMGYFASENKFRIVSLSTTSSESSPTPNRFKKIIDIARSNKGGALFLDSGTVNPQMETIANEAALRIGGWLIADGPGAAGTETTFRMWLKNANTIAAALK